MLKTPFIKWSDFDISSTDLEVADTEYESWPIILIIIVRIEIKQRLSADELIANRTFQS